MKTKKCFRFQYFLILIFMFVVVNSSFPQPNVTRNVTGTSYTSAQFGSASNKKVQQLYVPDELTGRMSGDITKVYFIYHTTTPQSFADLVVSIGQTNNTKLTTTFETGLTEVFRGALNIPSGGAGNWFEIALHTPYLNYDANKPLIIETMWETNPTNTSWAIRTGANDASGVDRKIYASSTTATTGIMATSRANFGFLVTQSAMNYFSSIVGHPTSLPVLVGSVNQPIVRVDVQMNGVLNPLNVTEFTLNTNGTTNTSDISNAKFFFTGTNGDFSTANQFGTTVSSPSGIFNFSGTQQLSAGKNYFWLTYDIPQYATPYNLVDAECTSLIVDGISRTPTVTSPAGNRVIRTPLTGIKTIGTGGDYPNLSAAVDELNNVGVGNGGITFNINAGQIFEESPVRIVATGTASNPIFFRSSVSGNNPTFKFTGTVGTTDAAIRLVGSDYITFDGITVQMHDSVLVNFIEYGFHFVDSTGINGCKNNTVKNCVINLHQYNNQTRAVNFYTAGTSLEGTNSFNKFLNNTVRNSHTGYYFDGQTAYPDEGNEVGTEGDGISKIHNIGSTSTGSIYGVYLGDQINFNISNTLFDTLKNVTNNGIYGVYLVGTGNIGTIENNVIRAISGAGVAHGVYINSASRVIVRYNKIHDVASTHTSTGIMTGIYTGGSQAKVYIYNNFIYDLRNPTSTSTTSGTSGLYLTGGDSISVYYNTVMLDYTHGVATNTSSTIMVGGTSPTNVDLRNNIFINKSDPTTGAWAAVFRKNGIELANLSQSTNNNLYYINNPGGKKRYYFDGTNSDITLTAYKLRVTPRDQASVSEDPPFVSSLKPYNLHLRTDTVTALESGGVEIKSPIEIGDDYEGDLRFGSIGYSGTGTAPDIGADEFEGIPIDVVPPTISYKVFRAAPVTTSLPIGNIIITDPSGVNIGSGTRPRLYYKKSGDNNTYLGNTSSDNGWKWIEAVGTTGSPFSFTIDHSILYNSGGGSGSVSLGDTIQYFFVAADSLGYVGINSGIFNITPSSVNLTADAFPVTGSINSYVIKPSFNGSYTLGGSSAESFPTLKSFFDAINNGVVTGNLNATITGNLVETESASLDEMPEFPPLSSYRMTIQPSGERTVSGAVQYALIKFNGADRITVDGLNANGNSLALANTLEASQSAVIHIASLGNNLGSTDITIRNCKLTGSGNYYSTGYVIHIGGPTIAYNGTGADNHNIKIHYNIISKAYNGIYARGTTSRRLDSLSIIGNTIGSEITEECITFRGIDVHSANSPVISQNTVFNLQSSATYDIAGIDLGTTTPNALISRNKIYSIRQIKNSILYGAYGILISSSVNNAGITIVNNVIYDIVSNGGGNSTDNNPFGIRITGGNDMKVYYNSINLTGSLFSKTTSDLSAAIIVTSPSVIGLDVRNNIFANSMTGGPGSKAYAIYNVFGVAYNVINHNDYYASGLQGVLGFASSDITSIAAWRTVTGQDANSIALDPLFNSPTVLGPMTGSPVLGAGVSLPGITIDHSGIPRGYPPSIGAYESGGDIQPPLMIYNKLTHTTSIINRQFNGVEITDINGINVAPGTSPRIYYKKTTNANDFIDNTNSTNGWKYTETTGSNGSAFNFIIDYSKLFGGSVGVGDVIQYFIVAQDMSITPNVGIKSGVFATIPSSVNLTSSAFPISGVINSYNIASLLSGTYNVGSGQTITSLTGNDGLFSVLNNNVVGSNLTISIMSDLDETGIVALNKWVEEGAGGYYVTVQPSDQTERLISGNSALGLIRLSGANRIIFDGRYAGLGKYLRFRNTNTTMPTFYFINDASNNIIRHSVIEAAVTTGLSGAIYFGEGLVSGNDNNTIDNNFIRNRTDATGVIGNMIYSLGKVPEGINKDESIQVKKNSHHEKKDVEFNTEMIEEIIYISKGTNSEAANSGNLITNNEIFNFNSSGIHITGTGNGDGWIISRNSFYNDLSTPPSLVQTGIKFLSGSKGNIISNNYIGGSEKYAGGTPWTNSGANAFVGMELFVDTSQATATLVKKNVIQNIYKSSTSTATFTGITLTGGSAIIDSNIVGDNTTPYSINVCGSSTTHGINIQPKQAAVTVSNNLIANLYTSGGGSSVRVRGITLQGDTLGLIKIQNNTIHSLSTVSGGTGISGTAPVAVGIYHFPPDYGTFTEIIGNTIYAIQANNSNPLGSISTGMMLTNFRGIASANKIYDIRNLSSGANTALPPIASGIYIRFCSSASIYNNMISLGFDQITDTEFNGIWNAGGATDNSYGLYYNSVNIAGTLTYGIHNSFGFLRGDNTGAVQQSRVMMRNNILNNIRTGGDGKHYTLANQNSIGDSTGWTLNATNYNLLNNVNGLHLTLWGIADLKITDWQAVTGCDLNSKTGNPLFISSSNLHITDSLSPASNAGIPVMGITTDFDGDPRDLSMPDIGADEFASGVVIISVNVNSGWNMVSNPVTRNAGTDSVKQLYPSSLNEYAFSFIPGSGYQQKYLLQNGTGYWIKFPGATLNTISGAPRTIDSIEVVAGWNMVGSISSTIDTSAISSVPPGLKVSHWFGYDGGYSASSQIIPGKAYWIKSSSAGKFVFKAGSTLSKNSSDISLTDNFNSITITDNEGNSQTLYFGVESENVNSEMYELPPVPPVEIFDARFESDEGGYLLRTHKIDLSKPESFSIKVQSMNYPITIQWKVNSDKYSYDIIDGDRDQKFAIQTLNGEGEIYINNSDISHLVLVTKGAEEIPAEYELMQNYPNPFNPVTNIKFALPEPGKVTVEIYNILGQKVRTLISEEREAGYHIIEWNGRNDINQFLGSGVYYVRLSADGSSQKSFIKVRKMILLR